MHSALTSLKIRVAVSIKMKRQLDRTRDKIVERRKSALESSLINAEQQQKLKQLEQGGEKETPLAEEEERKKKEANEKKDQAARNATKQHRLNLLKAV